MCLFCVTRFSSGRKSGILPHAIDGRPHKWANDKNLSPCRVCHQKVRFMVTLCWFFWCFAPPNRMRQTWLRGICLGATSWRIMSFHATPPTLSCPSTQWDSFVATQWGQDWHIPLQSRRILIFLVVEADCPIINCGFPSGISLPVWECK